MSSAHDVLRRFQTYIEDWPNLRDDVPRARQVAGDLGLLALDLPERLGGHDLSCTDLVPLFVEAGRHDADLRDYIGLGHAGLFLHAKTRKFDEVLRANATGRSFTAIAITECQGGSDLKALQTRAELTGDFYVLNGTKSHVSRLEDASDALVFAQVIREGTARLSCFLVPSWAIGLTITSRLPVGLSGQSWGSLALRNVEIPAVNRIGGEGEGFALFRKHFARWRLFMAAIALGVGQSALAVTAERFKTRCAFGDVIGRFTHLQLGYAKHAARLHAAHCLLIDAAMRIDAREAAPFYGAMVKAEIVETARAAADFALTVHGAEGAVAGHPVRKKHDDLDALRVADGTTDVLRGQVARHLLGEDLYQRSLGRRPSINSAEE